MTKPTPEQIAKLPKWAQEHAAQREQELLLSRAFCFPTQPEPKQMSSDEVKTAVEASPKKLITGWFWNAYADNFRITQGCSDWVYHNSNGVDKITTQNMGRIYSSRADAILAARWDMCRRFAAALARLDKEAQQP